MKKSVLLGVSISAILAMTGANAAGYTCEELIEYTSCNTGYALISGDCVCDAGYYTNGNACTACPIGSYSSVNASQCTTCPTTGLVGPDDKPILATTVSTGSNSITACIVPTNVTIKGETGLYHFKSNCAYSGLTPGINGGAGGDELVVEQTACEEAGNSWVDGTCDCNGWVWFYSAESEQGFCVADEGALKRAQICDASDVAFFDFGDGECRCNDNDGQTADCDENGCYCE